LISLLLTALVVLLLLALVYVVAGWIIRRFGLPPEALTILGIVLVIIFLIWLIRALAGTDLDLDLYAPLTVLTA
jgi:hypothetical protein